MVGLAYMYETGKGVEKNPQQAIAYYKLAADWGDTSASIKIKDPEK
jgi:TPR repeat protein